MPLPIMALALVALPFMGGKLKKADTTTLLVGGLALLWFSGKTAQALKAAGDKVNIVPETGEFFEGLFKGAKTDYRYAQDQSGSPNPPTQPWWEMAQDLGPTERGPIRVADGIDVPTSPIIVATLPSTAEKVGGAVRNFFTEAKLTKAIDPFEYF